MLVVIPTSTTKNTVDLIRLSKKTLMNQGTITKEIEEEIMTYAFMKAALSKQLQSFPSIKCKNLKGI